MQTEAEIETRTSKRLIEGWVGTKVSSFCYPYYWSHGYLADAVKNAGYDQARGGGGPRPLTSLERRYYIVPSDSSFDRFNVDSRQISQDENVGEWARPGCWHILTFHGIGGTHDGWEPISVGRFATHMAELAKHRDYGAVEVVTFKDGAERFRQPK